MEKSIAEGTESTIIGDWWASLEGLHARIAHRFARAELRERVRRYLSGLLERVEGKNGWQLAEAIGDTGPQGVQRLLNNAKWDANPVRDDLREYVVEHLADEEGGLLIVDETGFLKKAEKSVGVARQYTGTAGDTVNCQVGVFLAYSSKKGTAFIDRGLYLPKECTEDPTRCAEAGIPETVRFATKIELAKRMLKRAFEADVAAEWVVADSFYGRSCGFRHWLEKQGRSYYAVMVPKTNAVRYRGRRKRIDRLTRGLPEEAWASAPTEEASNGRRPWEWVCLMLSRDGRKGMRRWLLGRRSCGKPDDLTFYQAYGPKERPVKELVGICQARWAVEEGFAEAKGEVGLDHYEVRKWKALITATSRSRSWLTPTWSSRARPLAASRRRPGEKGGSRSSRANSDHRARGVRRLILAMSGPESEREFRLGWSLWRRAHQAVAARCRAAKRALQSTKDPRLANRSP